MECNSHSVVRVNGDGVDGAGLCFGEGIMHDLRVGLERVPFPLERILVGMGTVTSPLVTLFRLSRSDRLFSLHCHGQGMR